MKILIVNLTVPCESTYINKEAFPAVMLGKRIDRNPVFIVDASGEVHRVNFRTGDVFEMLNEVESKMQEIANETDN